MFGRPRLLPEPPIPDTTPGSTRLVSAASSGPNRSGSITATGRAPIARMSRTMPPTPVAAPWYGSTYDGWLCDSTLKVTAYPSPMSITPAFSPIPASILPAGVSCGVSADLRRCTFEDLYEQCSLHLTQYIASSQLVGRRPRMSRMRWYSSGFNPSSAHGCSASGVAAARLTVSADVVSGLTWAPVLVSPGSDVPLHCLSGPKCASDRPAAVAAAGAPDARPGRHPDRRAPGRPVAPPTAASTIAWTAAPASSRPHAPTCRSAHRAAASRPAAARPTGGVPADRLPRR